MGFWAPGQRWKADKGEECWKIHYFFCSLKMIVIKAPLLEHLGSQQNTLVIKCAAALQASANGCTHKCGMRMLHVYRLTATKNTKDLPGIFHHLSSLECGWGGFAHPSSHRSDERNSWRGIGWWGLELCWCRRAALSWTWQRETKTYIEH